ncbi:MAG: cbb3-type cytochrome c oxidase subunit 3 [Hyphomicrobium aestuarii]|nr:cbb3-type cytochrome c oxidase subunit 3 [Hyphomicrobium aestuarii]
MTYDTVAAFSQVTSLLMFVAMFLAVLAYALWPSNGAKFTKIQRSALDLDAKPLQRDTER